MFDIAPTEMLLCAVVALVVIGPKDLPRAMRTVGQFVAKVRGIGRQFRSGFDEMVREAELKEMEETWARENARIMREHPPEEIHDAALAHGDDRTQAASHDLPATAALPEPGAEPVARPRITDAVYVAPDETPPEPVAHGRPRTDDDRGASRA